jgi:hypothetical protein
VREFIDTVDQATPLQGEGAFARQRVIDFMLEMADRLVDLQHAFARSVGAAGAPLGASDRGVGGRLGDSIFERTRPLAMRGARGEPRPARNRRRRARAMSAGVWLAVGDDRAG